MNAAKITEEWLIDCGFKWHQFDRQPTKHWTIWIGGAVVDYTGTTNHDSLGIELAEMNPQPEGCLGLWYCWIRSDIAGRYSRIIHVRHVAFVSEVEQIIAALTGREVNWNHSLYGSLHSPIAAERFIRDRERLDQKINLSWVDRVDKQLGLSEVDKAKEGVQLP